MAQASPARALPLIKRILVPTDLTSCSEAALMYAFALAERFGAALHIINVIGREPMVGSMGEPYIADDKVEEFAMRRLREHEPAAISAMPHELTVHRGSVWKVTSRLAAEESIDLMVIGTHGRHGARYLVSGSVAEHILLHAPCPVITLGPEIREVQSCDGRFSEILVATDFSAASLKALDFAVKLAACDNGTIILFHAVSDEMTETEEEYAVHSAELTANARERLAALIPANCKVNRLEVVRIGAPAGSIIKLAKEIQPDLIAMGAHGGASAATHWPKSVDHAVICEAPCPVLTVCA